MMIETDRSSILHFVFVRMDTFGYEGQSKIGGYSIQQSRISFRVFFMNNYGRRVAGMREID